MTDTSIITTGSIVAVYVSKYPEFPQIGKVQSRSDTEVTISWFDGSFNDIWSEVKLKGGGKWCETVNKSNIILYDIQFTKGYRLRKDCGQVLRKFLDESVPH